MSASLACRLAASLRSRELNPAFGQALLRRGLRGCVGRKEARLGLRRGERQAARFGRGLAQSVEDVLCQLVGHGPRPCGSKMSRAGMLSRSERESNPNTRRSVEILNIQTIFTLIFTHFSKCIIELKVLYGNILSTFCCESECYKSA